VGAMGCLWWCDQLFCVRELGSGEYVLLFVGESDLAIDQHAVDEPGIVQTMVDRRKSVNECECETTVTRLRYLRWPDSKMYADAASRRASIKSLRYARPASRRGGQT